jgi:hypothetical protein
VLFFYLIVFFKTQFPIKVNEMSLKIYRIDSSLSGKIANLIKKPDLPPLGAGAIFLGNPLKNIRDLNRENSYVLSKADEIKRFREAFGNDWVSDIYYIRHPKQSQSNCLIPAVRFHQHIVREQIADIISYMRANLKIQELEINIVRGSSGKLGLSGVVENVPLEGEVNVDLSDEYSAVIKCLRPLRASEKKQTYTWLEDFPHVISIVDDAESGAFTIKEKFDLSFGLSIKAAKAIGASVDWNTQHTFNFTVTVD